MSHMSETAKCDIVDSSSELDSVPQPVRSSYPLHFDSLESIPTVEEYSMKRHRTDDFNIAKI